MIHTDDFSPLTSFCHDFAELRTIQMGRILLRTICSHESYLDITAVLDNNEPPVIDLQRIPLEPTETAVAILKTGKFTGVHIIPAELVQASREVTIYVVTKICNKSWRTSYGISRRLLHSPKRATCNSVKTTKLLALSVI